MAATSFKTSTMTFRELMGNGSVYQVPRFQRDYSWTDTEWEDLWQDIIALETSGEQGHYMGYLVLQSLQERKLDVIDGQQRLTTLSLIVLTVLKNLSRLIEMSIDPENNEKRIRVLEETYIGFVDPVTLVSQLKLRLNRNNNEYYKQYIATLSDAPKIKHNASEKLMRDCFEWFDAKMREKFGEAPKGESLAEFVTLIAESLFFTVIYVTDELNAFKVFETLNARGVRLSTTDLLKNYFFSKVFEESGHEATVDELEKQWDKIVANLGEKSFPDFLRTFWNSRNKLARKKDLFNVIRENVRQSDNKQKRVFELTKNMAEDSSVYAALGNPTDEFWTSKEKRDFIAELKMYRVTQPYTLLLAASRSMDDEDFIKTLRACSIISFRYNVIGKLSPNRQEPIYNDVAIKISSREFRNSNQIINGLRDIYPTDEQFRAAFEEASFPLNTQTKKLIRHILFKIEKFVSKEDYDAESNLYSIEHVLPENPGEDWPDFDHDEQSRFAYRVGNLTLLKTPDNRRIGNSKYEEKIQAYRDSAFEITRKIPEHYQEWTPEKIASRQEWMAKQAVSIWRLTELS